MPASVRSGAEAVVGVMAPADIHGTGRQTDEPSRWRPAPRLARKMVENLRQGGFMAYDLDQFIADSRSTLKRDPGPAGREPVRLKFEKLLGNPEFIEKYCGDDQPRGLKLLYEDPSSASRCSPISTIRRGFRRRTITEILGDLRPGGQMHRHDRVEARGRRHRSQARQAEEVKTNSGSPPAMPATTSPATSTRSTIPTTRGSSA